MYLLIYLIYILLICSNLLRAKNNQHFLRFALEIKNSAKYYFLIVIYLLIAMYLIKKLGHLYKIERPEKKMLEPWMVDRILYSTPL